MGPRAPRTPQLPQLPADIRPEIRDVVDSIAKTYEDLWREVWDLYNRGFWALISAASGAPNQWTYTWAEVVKETAGYGGWVSRGNGRSGTSGFNSTEDRNSGSAAVPNNTIVWMREVQMADATMEYWFELEA